MASAPIDEMFARLDVSPGSIALDCGCGTGYSTAKLAGLVGPTGKVIGIDLTEAMVRKAQDRAARTGYTHVEFRIGDVLEQLKLIPPQSVDVAVMTWLIGYVSLDEILPLIHRILKPAGVVGFVAHLDRSPQIPWEVFEKITREDPGVLLKAVRMTFPVDAAETELRLVDQRFEPVVLYQDSFDFVCHRGQEVYDHVMKSGAGTTFYYSLEPSARKRLAAEFIRRVEQRFLGQPEIRISHRYVVGIAKPLAQKLLCQQTQFS